MGHLNLGVRGAWPSITELLAELHGSGELLKEKKGTCMHAYMHHASCILGTMRVHVLYVCNTEHPIIHEGSPHNVKNYLPIITWATLWSNR